MAGKLKYHINPETGRPNQCEAKTPETCLYYNVEEGVEAPHFRTKTEARAHVEKTMAEIYGGNAKKTISKSSQNKNTTQPLQKTSKIKENWPDITPYVKQLGTNDSVFVHPQGKVIIIDGDTGKMNVFKDGKPSSSSATPDKLRMGRGRWKKLKGTFDPIPDVDKYNKNFSRTEQSSNDKQNSDEKLRNIENRKAGYPPNSNLNASKFKELNMRDTPVNTYSPYNKNKSSAILPIRKSQNPHKDLAIAKEDDYGLKFWNNKDKGDIANFEVWSDGNGHYKAVTTSGQMRALGSVSSFYHDQTFANMGDKWTMVGAFNAEENGAAIGEIPNKKIPIYTYK